MIVRTWIGLENKAAAVNGGEHNIGRARSEATDRNLAELCGPWHLHHTPQTRHRGDTASGALSTWIGLENESADVNGSERKRVACADMRTKRMLQKRPISERGHQPQPRRARWALASASHSSDALGGLPLAAKL
eukprot:CAMPEP_0204212744 /NCGR_PEP_ID=MMETSP0361-20130328/75456_1 /ASSEMBLY_ACC=CAM_ASM_000343 /TAXON_ID=268821 /ORGANISM="Scrippsiella Hangoei, Strain SHTV-5" /LENGTH=133 /DNA_ID=CAMNT_0051177107 /DNA_START=112 /DNA_END=510 /DNA_ORIENTATION=+